MSANELAPTFFLAVLAILVVCKLVAVLAARLGQPPVVGEMIAGVLVAIVGKFGACWLAARLSGEPRPVAVRVGILMNARGLMQLIALNLGLQAGIVSPGCAC